MPPRIKDTKIHKTLCIYIVNFVKLRVFEPNSFLIRYINGYIRCFGTMTEMVPRDIEIYLNKENLICWQTSVEDERKNAPISLPNFIFNVLITC